MPDVAGSPSSGDPRPPTTARWLRVPAFTLPNVTLAVVAHLAAGGRAPDAPTVAALVAGVTLLTLGVSGRRRSLPGLLGAVVLVQIGVHIALLDHHATPAGQPVLVGPGMVVAHALASAVLAWWLARGEDAVWRTAVRAIARLRRSVCVPARARRVGHPVLGSGPVWSWAFLLAAVGLRAPPEAA